MRQNHPSRRALLSAGLALIGAPAFAQSPKFRPGGKTGEGIELDAPYVPTPPDVVAAMLALAQVNRDDFVIDLGCGDGRIPIAAAKTSGARGYGVDIDPQRIAEAQALAKAAGVEHLVRFEVKDIFATPLGAASVLTLYLFPHLNDRLAPIILEQTQPGARVVSHGFPIGKWRPDREDIVSGRRIFFWVVPARVEGRWRIITPGGRAHVADFTQRFQLLRADLPQSRGGRIRNPRLSGRQIAFTLEAPGAPALELAGEVKGAAMAGKADGGQAWFAQRLWPQP